MASSSDKDKVMEIDRLERIDWCDIFKGINIFISFTWRLFSLYQDLQVKGKIVHLLRII